MARFKAPADRRSEAVNVRLTPDEKELADHLVEITDTSLTELFRDFLYGKAKELGLPGIPKRPSPCWRRPSKKKKRGRPPKSGRR